MIADKETRMSQIKALPHYQQGLAFTVSMVAESLNRPHRSVGTLLTEMTKARILTSHKPVGGREVIYTRAPESEMCRKWTSHDNGIRIGLHPW